MRYLFIIIFSSLLFFSCNSKKKSKDEHNHSEQSEQNHNEKEVAECCAEDGENTKIEQSDNSLYDIELEFTNMDNKKVNLSDFKGKYLITSMIFTSCEYACPTIVNNTKMIQEELGDDLDIQYMFVSFDHKRDTPEQLKTFHKEQKLNKDWTFLTGSSSNIRIYSMIFNISYQELDNGDFSHSNAIFLVGKNGEILDTYEGIKFNTKEVAKKIKEKIREGEENV